jgi:Tfp pilus assembly protein PilX
MKKQSRKNGFTFLPARHPSENNGGFALIVTITLMALMVILALGFLSLGSISLRESTASQPRKIAQANARLSLQLAVSRLQELAGPDTRVTAPADAVAGSSATAPLTGVWRSWEGNNHEPTTGMPHAPAYASKLQTGTLAGSETGRFIGWLISGTEAGNSANSPAPLEKSDDTVPLLAEGTLGNASGSQKQVHLIPTAINYGSDTVGSYAWWIQGENTKARLRPPTPINNTMESTEQMLVSPGPSGSGFNIEDTTHVSRAISRPSLDSIAKDATLKPSEFFHDVTSYSTGLLTNTANGGWRRDLSLFSENFNSISEGFSSFTLSPGYVFRAGKSHTTASTSASPLVYPWAAWSNSIDHPDVVSWNALVDFATQYKQLKTSGNEVARFLNVTNQDKSKWVDQVHRIPVLARIHLVISLSAREQPANSGTYVPCVIVNPVITMWNPYSVGLDMSSTTFYFSLNDAACPINFTFQVGSLPARTMDLARIATNNVANQDAIDISFPANEPPIWLPGEVRVFSATGSALVDRAAGTALMFRRGYRPGSGIRYVVPGFSRQPETTTFAVSKAENSATFDGPNVKGTGIYFTHSTTSRFALPRTTNVQCMLQLADAQRMLGMEIPLNTTTNPPSLGSLATSPQPLVSIVSSLRFGRDTNATMDNIMANGIHHMNPVIGFIVNSNLLTEATDLKGRFDAFPYNVEFFAVNSVADPGMPSGITDELEGYLGSGFGSGDGLSNLILLEIPTRPLRSIGDLQHFTVNACGRTAPYTLNALGNSSASPFIGKDRIRLSGTAEMGHDHSYAINHVLLDDWFVSSVAPDTNDWSATVKRDTETVYADHLSGKHALPNHYYRPREILSDQEASSTAAGFVSDTNAWEKVAAELVVEGMFNINSTSERAWAMLLKRNFASDYAGVLTLDNFKPGNTAASAKLEKSAGSPFPRSVPISDAAAGAPAYSLLGQHQRFSDEQITALAREIVVEVRKRGPFLSLSEFFNRQLSDNADLARAGAVESALMRLAEENGSGNPYRSLQAVFSDSASTTDVLGQPLTHPFPEAAVGNPAYGFPGWIRQADVLRSISGILTARDDTFIIRAYGDARDQVTNEVISRAWCEAVVQRQAEFLNNSSASGDDIHALPSESTLNSEENQRFGRGFKIIHFRWLHPNEI